LNAVDFEYDGQYLSDFGFIICHFDGGAGLETVSAGAEITFNTVAKRRGKAFTLVSSQYDSCITTTFQICKNVCDNDDSMVITDDEYRDIARWLNRTEFCEFMVLYDDENDAYRDPCYFNAGFNLSRITIGDELFGIELTLETDSPFGYGPLVQRTYTITDSSGGDVTFTDPSDDIGYVYPDVVLTCSDSGAYNITNAMTGTVTTITGCTSGEVITMQGEPMIITSSLSTHDIASSFNFIFMKVGNTYASRQNTITVSKPCTLQISYNPIVKSFM